VTAKAPRTKAELEAMILDRVHPTGISSETSSLR
jgi:hypothetical protein